MNIQEYIEKHRLTLWKKMGPNSEDWHDVNLTNPDDPNLSKEWETNIFEIYANADRTHFVSMNTTRKLFRIIHNELVTLKSGWKASDMNYIVQPIE